MRLSELSRARRASFLAEHGISIRDVLRDLQDAARESRELRDAISRCRSDEELEQLAFEWFENHSQPAKRRNWLGSEGTAVVSPLGTSSLTYRTRDWPGDWLPTPEDDEGPVVPSALPLLRGESQLGWYTHGHLQGAARRLDRHEPVNEVAARTRLTPDDARRVRLLLERELASVSGGQLAFHVTLARKGDRYALRYLDERGERWLDPNRTLLQR
jgi:hypothetical protein